MGILFMQIFNTGICTVTEDLIRLTHVATLSISQFIYFVKPNIIKQNTEMSRQQRSYIPEKYRDWRN
jgi:hypothetical protein